MANASSQEPIGWGALLSYSLFALPFAAAGLPIYINLPQIYAEGYGLDLTSIGLLLLLVRVIDTVQDPIIGSLCDRYVKHGAARAVLIGRGAPFFVLIFVAMFMPPVPENYMAWYFFFALLLLNAAFSFLQVNYYALGAEMHTGYNQRNRITAAREIGVLFGILMASALPQFLVNMSSLKEGYFHFALIVGALILVLLPLVFKKLPRPNFVTSDEPTCIMTDIKKVFAHKQFLNLLGIFFVNGLANAIPAVLVLFFISDVIHAPEQSGYFLGVYFLSGLVGMPIWTYLAKKTRKRTSLLMSMALLMGALMFGLTLGEDDIMAFYVFCILSGFCLGADLSLPPSILADVIDQGCDDKQCRGGAYFGVWNVAFSMTFALAAGVVLPGLEALGYNPETPPKPETSAYLLYAYVAIPAVLKLIALVWLAKSTIDKEPRTA